MEKRARRSTGTISPLQSLLLRMKVLRRSPEKDRADLDGGQPLQVVAFSKSLGGEALIPVGKGKKIARLKAGRLQLAAGEAPVWTERGRQGITLVPPLALEGEGERLPVGQKLRKYTLQTGQGRFDLVIPLVDVELVRHAFATTAL